jgi:hypothetical protein
MPRIHILDVTNRDGVQTARINLSKFGKTMVNFYLGKLGVTQSEAGFPFLFHEVPYLRANLALAKAGAFGSLRLSGWTRAVVADVDPASPLGVIESPPPEVLSSGNVRNPGRQGARQRVRLRLPRSRSLACPGRSRRSAACFR